MFVALYLWENKKEEEQMFRITRDERLSRLPLRLSTGRIVELVQLRENTRPVGILNPVHLIYPCFYCEYLIVIWSLVREDLLLFVMIVSLVLLILDIDGFCLQMQQGAAKGANDFCWTGYNSRISTNSGESYTGSREVS